MNPIRTVFSGIVLLIFAFTLNAQDQYVWTQKTSIPAVGRHRACGCAVGDRGYIGLGHINNSTNSINYPDWWEYDPGTDSWMQKANFPPGGRYHAIAFSVGNFAYVGTGSDWGGDHDDMWKFSPATNTWTPIASLPGGVRSGAVAFSINGKGYVTLGDYQTDCWEYNPATGSWIQKAMCPVGGYSSVGAVLNGKAYVGVGEGTQWMEFDPVGNIWTMKPPYQGPSYVFGSGCFAYDGWIYVVSGSNWTDEYPYSYAFNPATNTWVQTQDFPGQARHYFTCFTIGNRAYGGTGTSGTNFNDFWEFGTLSGIEDHAENKEVKIFPNPVVDRAEFDFTNSVQHEALFTLTSLDGKKVREEKIEPCNSWLFDRNDLAAGTYVYSISSETKIISNGTLILQ